MPCKRGVLVPIFLFFWWQCKGEGWGKNIALNHLWITFQPPLWTVITHEPPVNLWTTYESPLNPLWSGHPWTAREALNHPWIHMVFANGGGWVGIWWILLRLPSLLVEQREQQHVKNQGLTMVMVVTMVGKGIIWSVCITITKCFHRSVN
jgi:hypothetical protein